MRKQQNNSSLSPIKQINVTNEEFFTTAISFIDEGKQVEIPAKGRSMLPFIREGKDTIIMEKLNNDSIKRGNIVLALQENGRYVLHRIEKTEKGDKVILRGDGNPYQREQCNRSDILAEATAVIRNGKTIAKGSTIWNLSTHFWPRNSFVRRVLLKAYRMVFPSYSKPNSPSSQNS